jgi:hypothetical protein
MHLDTHLLALIIGVLATTFGGLIVFNDEVFNGISSTLWKPSEQDKKSWSPQGIHNFNRYGRGLGLFLGGIILTIVAVAYYFTH